jgi:hypothetical protein
MLQCHLITTRIFGFKLLRALVIKRSLFWDETPCGLVKADHLGFSLFAWFILHPEDVGDTFLQNVGCLSSVYIMLYPRRQKIFSNMN